MKKRVVAAFEIEDSFELFAYTSGLGLNEDCLDPIVERFQLESRVSLSFVFCVC